MQESIIPLAVFTSAFSISAFAGLAALLRAGGEVTKKSVLSAMLNSGLLGLTIALMWYVTYKENKFFLIGVCIIAGLGGNDMIDYMLKWLKAKINNVSVKEINNEHDQADVPNKP